MPPGSTNADDDLRASFGLEGDDALARLERPAPTAHLSRTPYDPGLWRELVLLSLPGGRVAVAKNFGSAATAAGPGAGTVTVTCTDPLRTVRTHLRTGAHLLDDAALAAGPLVDGVREPVRAELAWATSAPVWSLSADMGGQDWADTHYEVPCRVTGTVRWPDGDGSNGGDAPYRLELAYPGGRAVIEAEPARSGTLSIVPPYEWVLGARGGADTSHHVFEAHTRFRWDGVTGAGLTERTRRLGGEG